ncbi:MAG: hypothetical protein OXC95_18680 [Dehalococcoidia bacterium]|nr:hypothetical protein [Dehalococcoidia bacterium]
MHQITIEKTETSGLTAVKVADETVGSLSFHPSEEGYRVSVTFGPDLPDGLETEIALATPAYSIAVRVAKALAAIGREPDYVSVAELAPDTCYRLDVHAGDGETALSGHTETPEFADFISRILGPVIQATGGLAHYGYAATHNTNGHR